MTITSGSNHSVPFDKVETFEHMLQDVFVCPVCGLPKVHYRLRGYQCHNEQHNEMVANGWKPDDTTAD